ncbi:hypothetical protein ACFS5J_03825 [Flavobacterium chuncheonense]|uniref:Uncharacterized protein n=1 Tax=Flavobacterium chuncheonense TaxID=2026653 RepID=A0ABW5YJ91_9FLAO
MKKTIIILIVFFGINKAFSQLKDTLYGKVKSVREEIIFLDEMRQNFNLFGYESDYGHSGFGSNDREKSRFYSNWYNTSFVHYLNYYKEFDKSGKPTNEVWFDKDYDTISRYTYKYDKRGNLIQKVEYDDDNNSFRVDNSTYSEDTNLLMSKLRYYSDEPNSYGFTFYNYEDEKLIEVTGFNSIGNQFTTKFVYNGKGNKVKKVVLNFYEKVRLRNGSITGYRRNYAKEELMSEYFYDSQNRLIEAFHYGENSQFLNEVELKFKEKSFYSKDNLLEYFVETTQYDTILKLYHYKYDKLGRKIIEKRLVPIHDVKKITPKTHIFDVKELTFKDVHFPKNNLKEFEVMKYIYDKENLIELQINEGSFKSVCRFEYFFDEKKNWIEQTKTVNGEKLYVWKRKITYY